MRLYVCKTAKGIPVWMYYVRSIMHILEDTANMFAFPFHKQLGFATEWDAYMLRCMSKNFKKWRLNK